MCGNKKTRVNQIKLSKKSSYKLTSENAPLKS